MAKDGGGFDFSAINGSMAKQLVKDMLAAFDADTNRKRLAKAILAARDDNSDSDCLDFFSRAVDAQPLRRTNKSGPKMID